MKNDALKKFFKDYKAYLVDTDRSIYCADQYCTYLRKACALLNLGEGFIEAIVAISDVNVQASLCEYLMAKLSNEFKSTTDKALKKQISNYKSAVAAFSEFLTYEEDENATILSLLPAVTLPFESVYDQKELINIFKSRLESQERYYMDAGDNASFSARVIKRIATKTKRKDIYKALILNTRFLYQADENKFFRLSEISQLIVKTDGFVKIEVKGTEYDVYTQVYVKGKFMGYELLRVGSVALVSLDHVRSMHELYPSFLDEHVELKKLSDNVLKHRRVHSDMNNSQFATHYYNEIYQNISADEGIVIDENLLMDDVCEFIEKLELIILHKSYNSSKNDN